MPKNLIAHWIMTGYTPLRRFAGRHAHAARTHQRARAIEVAHAACKDELRQNTRSHSCGVFFSFSLLGFGLLIAAFLLGLTPISLQKTSAFSGETALVHGLEFETPTVELRAA